MAEANVVNGHSLLHRHIAQRIATHPQQRITFAEYMALVLYHPQYGYYTSPQNRIGAKGDFVTSPHLGHDFGELLAEQIVQLWYHLGHPSPFTLVEMGAGQGLLIQDILRYLHRHHFPCFDVLEYRVIEQSRARVVEQRHRFQALTQSWGRLQWCTWDDIAPDSIVGCFFSNELVDAFPVHQVVIQQGELREMYVAIAADSNTVPGDMTLPAFTEVIGELSTPQLAAYFDLIGIPLPSPAYPEGYRSEVNLAALDWLAGVASRLQRGYVLTIDYGYPASRYYNPRRSQGTLQCYYQHRHHDNPYIYMGQQDITTHVDFTALERQGERCGLQTVGFTQQGLFLMALGLGDRLTTLTDPTEAASLSVNESIQRRQALHSLIDFTGMGNFGVLIQSKGVDSTLPIQGLLMPTS